MMYWNKIDILNNHYTAYQQEALFIIKVAPIEMIE